MVMFIMRWPKLWSEGPSVCCLMPTGPVAGPRVDCLSFVGEPEALHERGRRSLHEHRPTSIRNVACRIHYMYDLIPWRPSDQQQGLD